MIICVEQTISFAVGRMVDVSLIPDTTYHIRLKDHTIEENDYENKEY